MRQDTTFLGRKNNKHMIKAPSEKISIHSGSDSDPVMEKEGETSSIRLRV